MIHNQNSVYFFLQTTAFLGLLPVVREHIIDGFNPKARDMFRREFDFFEKVTSISGVLYPLPKEERRAGIRRYLSVVETIDSSVVVCFCRWPLPHFMFYRL